MEVEKSPKNHLFPSNRKQKWVFLPPMKETFESEKEQKAGTNLEFRHYGKGVKENGGRTG